MRPPAPFGCPTYYDAGHDSSRCGHCRGRDRVWNGSKWAATDEAKPASPGLRAAGEVANEIYYSPPMFNGRCAVLTADRRSTLDHFVGWLKEDTTIIRFPTMKDAHAAYKKEFLS